jgi:very-short-patch-repair endonuclease
MAWQRNVPKEDTKPELAMRRILEDSKLSFVSQEPIKTRFSIHSARVDFIVERFLIVRVHGRYWHSRKRPANKDAAQKECLKAEKYWVLDFSDEQVLKHRELVSAVISGFYCLKKLQGLTPWSPEEQHEVQPKAAEW